MGSSGDFFLQIDNSDRCCDNANKFGDLSFEYQL